MARSTPFRSIKPAPPAPAPVVIPEVAYYRLRTKILELQTAQEAMRQELAKLQAGVQEAMRAAGLDPTRLYQLDDATLSATLQPAAPPARGPR